MTLRDLRTQFKDTIPISNGFLKLMKNTFGFYSSLCNDFFSHLGNHVEVNTLGNYLQTEIRPRLFDVEYCKKVESIKKQFLSENIKLEQFIEKADYKNNYINDLLSLKKVSEAIYELLQTHWEFFKYEKSVAGNEAIIAFILEIDRIGIRWDAYLEKYLAVSGVLKADIGESLKEGYTPLSVQYNIPNDARFTIEMSTNLIQFFQLSYEFVLKVHNATNEKAELEMASMEVGHPVNCELLVPEIYFESFSKFLGYLSVDVLKRETLVKFVMEIVRLQQGKEVPKTAITNFQKKIAKQLDLLHPEGYLSINKEGAEDSVALLSSLCKEMDRLKIEYNDLLTGSTNRLTRNQDKPLSQISTFAKKITPLPEDKKENAIRVPADPSEKSKEKPLPDKPEKKSTVKIDVKNKEHIRYLTS